MNLPLLRVGFNALIVLGLLLGTAGTSFSQNGLYSENFENETPYDVNNLCLPGFEYSPADANWSLGPACAVSTNGIPKLVDVAGDIYLEYNQQYPANSEVWNSKTVSLSGSQYVLVSFNARSVGGHENSGPYEDAFALHAVKDYVESASPLVAFSGHVNGSGNGSPATVTESFTTSLYTGDASSLSLRIRVKISGADGSESYQVDGFSVCPDNDNDGVCDCDVPVTFNVSFDDYSIQCAADLPETCMADVIPSRGTITGCQTNQRLLQVDTCIATTAIGPGEDGAILLKAVNGDPLDDRYFVPTGDGMRLVQYSNNTARVFGQVADINDPTAILNVDIHYGERVSGAEWDGGFKAAYYTCILTTDITDAWDIYIMNNGMSWLTGEGSLSGTLLQLSHAPALEYFGFQVGEMANDINCNYGAGGWFAYQGKLNGIEIQGGQGDVLLDLECGSEGRNGCPSEEVVNADGGANVTFSYSWYDAACNQQETYTQTVSALDTEAPELFNLPADTVVVYCEEDLPDTALVTAADNCELDTLQFFTVSGLNQVCTGTYEILRNWTAIDCSGNDSTFTQIIQVVDTVGPVVTGAANDTVECDGSGNLAQLQAWLDDHAGAIPVDGCGTANWQEPPVLLDMDGDCGDTGSMTYEFTAVDDCGNTTSVEATFVIEDTTPPSITAAMDTTVECDGAGNVTDLATWIANNGGATATDICGAVQWDDDHDGLSNECGATGSVTVTFTATDDCLNSSTTTATFTIVDTTIPTLTTEAQNDTVECGVGDNAAAYASWLFAYGGASATDVCSGPVIVTDNSTGLSDLCGETGEETVTWTFTDSCGNFVTSSATFVIEDTTPPSITAATDTTVECDGAGNAAEYAAWLANHGGATAVDNCSGVTWSEDTLALSLGCFGSMTVVIEFTATDACGLSSSVQAAFIIEDTTKPDASITCPNDTTVYVDENCDVDLSTTALGMAVGTGSDICSGEFITDSLLITEHDTISECLGSFSFTRSWTYTVTDDCGNDSTVTCSQDITVLDTLAPVWDDSINMPYEFVACEDMPDPTDPTVNPYNAIDNCSGVRYEIEAHMMSGGCPGTWMRIWTAIDSCGNESEPVEQYIQLYDNQPPTIDLACPADYNAFVGTDCTAATDTVAAGTPTVIVTDNCDATPTYEVSYTDGAQVPGCGNTFSFTRTWKIVAEDYCEKKDSLSCDQLITLVDNTPPVFITAAENDTVECDGTGNTLALQNWLDSYGGATATDNCGDVTWSDNYADSNFVGDCGGTGHVDVTFYATDECENVDSTMARFVIKDTTPPVITALSPFVVDCFDWYCDIDSLAALGAVSAIDVCGASTLALDSCLETSVGCLSPGGFEVFYTATDDCGNTSSTSQIIVIRDTVPPVLTAMAQDTTTECDGAGNTAQLNAWLANNGGADAYDECDGVEWSNDYTALNDSCGNTGAVTVTFTASDCKGNMATTTATFIIEDTTTPTLDTPASDETVECDGAGNPTALQNWLDSHGGASASDLCSGPVTWEDDFVGLSDLCGSTGAVTVTFTGADECGNTVTTTATFTIEDTTPPVINVAASDTTTECDGAGNQAQLDAWLANHGGAEASEACGSIEWTYSDATLSDECGATGAVTVTFTATDECGLYATTEATFTVEDTSSPVISVAAESDTVECDGAGNLSALQAWLDANGGAMASDVCSGVMWYNNFECDIATGDFKVYNQGANSNPGYGDAGSSLASDYLDANFDSVFPDGLTTGCNGGNKLTFTSADAIDVYLPCTGGAQPLVLTGTTVDPDETVEDITCFDNALVTHLMVAKLNVAFDAANAGFSNSPVPLSSLIRVDGPLAGMSVAEIIALGDAVVGGCSAEFTANQMRGALRDLNQNFDGGNVNLGRFELPYCSDPVAMSDECGETGSVMVTFTAVDECGNESTTSASFVIEDTTEPSINVMAADSTVECDGAGNTAAFQAWLDNNGGADASDLCSGVNWSNNSTGLSDLCGATGSETVTFTAADDCGNTATTTATFTIEDTTPPTIDTEAADQTVECDGNGNESQLNAWLNSHGGASASDLCSGPVTWNHDYTGLSDLCGATGTANVTFTAFDDCGNSSTTTATFTIEDTTAPDAPAMTCPANATVYLDADCNAETSVDSLGSAIAGASDLCDSVPTLDEYYIETAPVFTCTGDDGNLQGSYTFTRTFYAAATDDCGLTGDTASCTQVITVLDTMAPILVLDSVFSIACELYDASALYAVSATDNCDSNVAITIASSIEQSGTCPATYLRTYSAKDDCGNVSTAVQVVNVIDTVAPELTLDCPSDTTLYLDASCVVDTTVTSTGSATTTLDDNCDDTPSLTVTYSDVVTPGCGSAYSVARTWTATAKDTCNNETSLTCLQHITVQDTLKPTISCPNDTVVECDGAGNLADLAAFRSAATAVDNCDIDVEVTDDYSADNFVAACAATGSVTITWTATDDCENSASCSATFTIVDTTIPTVDVAAENDTVECDGAGNTAALQAWLDSHGGASASDACSGASWSNDFNGLSNGCGATGEATVIFTATDSCLNFATTTATFVIRDTTPPSIDTEATDLTVECDGSGNIAERDAWLTANGNAAASDVCSGTIWSHDFTAIDTLCGITGSALVTFTVVDGCGNASTTSATFTIQDTTDPEFDPVCPNSAQVFANENCLADTTVATHGTAGFENEDDICDADLDMVITHADSVVYPCQGSMTVYRHWTITATDDCLNSTEKVCTQVITVTDNTPPTLTCGTDMTVECDGAGNTSDYTAFLAAFGSSDACSNTTEVFATDTTDLCGGTESRLVWFYATDACGNVDSCSATFTIEDTTNPTLDVVLTADTTVYLDIMCEFDTSFANLGGLNATAEDICSPEFVNITYSDSEALFTCPCEPEIDTTVFNPCRLIPGDFRTQTMGGWGQDNCNGNNPACYRDANFASAFPAGVSIGCAGGESLTFTSSDAVSVFLPCGGSPGSLSGSGTNSSCVSNVLAGQLLAAKLSLGFDAADANFGNAPVAAGNLIVDEGAYAGWTIQAIVNRADSILGGCLNASASNVANALATFNESFVDGDSYSNPNVRLGGCEDYYITTNECDEQQEGGYTFQRTFTVMAADECGNDTVATYVQNVTVEDTIAPQFTFACGLDNGINQDVCCEDNFGTVMLPAICEVEATDGCDSDVFIDFRQEFIGSYAPSEDVAYYCTSAVPSAFEDGESCSGHDPHNLRLFALPGGGSEFYAATNGGLVENNTDGTWSLSQEVTALDGSGGGWIIQVTYGEAMDWDDWSDQDFETSYKLDCGSEIDDHHDEWHFRLMLSGTLTGTGAYSGSNLSITHMPTNQFYALQIGEGANNQNGNFGYSGWLFYSGMFNGTPVMGSGDIFGDLDCCLPWSVNRTWTAMDDCGNDRKFSTSFTVNAEECTDGGVSGNLGGQTADDHTPVVIGGAGDLTTGKTPIRVTNLQPNPTNDWSLLGFTVTQNMRLRVDMYSMEGFLVQELYDGIATPNVNHSLDIEADQLQSGMYQIRLSSAQYLVVKKLLVTE